MSNRRFDESLINFLDFHCGMIAAGDESHAQLARSAWRSSRLSNFNTLDSSLIAGASNKLRNGNSTPGIAHARCQLSLAGNDRLIQSVDAHSL